MKKLSQSGELNDDTMLEIMMEQKKPENDGISISGEVLRKYFPRSYSPLRMQETIIKLLEGIIKDGRLRVVTAIIKDRIVPSCALL